MICMLSLCGLLLQPLVSHPNPPMVVFPDKVTKTPLTPSGPTHAQAYQKHLKDQYQTLSFQTQIAPKSQSQNQIRIPTTGTFQFILKEGPTFIVTDNNATDGTASITLPKGTFQTALKLNNAPSNHAQLDIHDPLYHLKDTLKPTDQPTWMDIGLRPIPIPTNWHSDNGNNHILQFKTQNIQSFHITWQTSTEKAPFPPGINEITPENGGDIILPGVGELHFPPNSIEKTTIFSMRQVKEYPHPS